MFEIRKRTEFDLALVVTAMALWIIGVLLVFSATHIYDSGPLVHSTRNQIIWIVMGIFIILIVTSIPTRFYFSFAYVMYGASLLLLMYGLCTGVISKGAERWVSIAGLRVQPSEFAKIGLLLALARYFSTKSISLDRLPSFLLPGCHDLVPFAFILKQPDFGHRAYPGSHVGAHAVLGPGLRCWNYSSLPRPLFRSRSRPFR